MQSHASGSHARQDAREQVDGQRDMAAHRRLIEWRRALERDVLEGSPSTLPSCTPTKWRPDPAPPLPYFKFAGSSLTQVTKSLKVLTLGGTAGPTAKAYTIDAAWATMTVIQFWDETQLLRFWNSSEYTEARKIRLTAGNLHVGYVPGFDSR